MPTPGSIFGKQCPRFWVGSTIVTLYYSNVDAKFSLPRLIEHESKINAHREWSKIGTGNHAEFVVKTLLYEYADPVKKYEEIQPYEQTTITKLAPHKDKDALKKSDGNYCEFFIEKIDPVRIFQPHFYDVVFITFKSKDPVDLSQGLYTAMRDDLDDVMTDDLDVTMHE